MLCCGSLVGMILYKYLKSKHLREFEQKGTIRLGTLEEYRNAESKRIGDPFEGKTVFRIITEDDEVNLSDGKRTNHGLTPAIGNSN